MNIYEIMAQELIEHGTDSALVDQLSMQQLDDLHSKSITYGRNVFAELSVAKELGAISIANNLRGEIETIKSFDDIATYR